ncbi:uncharacterized protein LOC132733585 [Ruditapes philippinarum]|uniref:uncharacterized protein LOC132733585 n=1 Tax=Ruditapes philippinarum TaxID=129788 RepID=UPI00295B065B|nr:uncharacterized protein LOC132733585 [Ruditapes philippinarum]
MEEMSIMEQNITEDTPLTIQERLKSFGFEKFKVPPLLCRHPPPATGRDDDIEKIREILDDVLVKTGYDADQSKCANRILCGPDNKIGKCLLRLMNRNHKYKTFLPEFPLLHLRKSKINILFSAYKDAGIVQLLKFMRNDEHDDWAKLVSIQHIDMATRHVKRIALALHLAFLISFTQNLNNSEQQELISDLETDEYAVTSKKWSGQFTEYLAYGSARNATFALHVDMMRHCDDIVSIAFAERLGGKPGYNLLLAAVKSSLLFTFVNGATSYAPYCVLLLHSHYTAGHFHQCMKQTLYSTPLKNSNRNFSSDTKREMDHIDVLKGFRSGSNVDSVTCRMSLIDSLNETRQNTDSKLQQSQDNDKLGMDVSEVDLNHIYPVTSLILRRSALSLEESPTPCNIYTKVPLLLPPTILDSASNDVGRYLLERYLRN